MWINVCNIFNEFRLVYSVYITCREKDAWKLCNINVWNQEDPLLSGPASQQIMLNSYTPCIRVILVIIEIANGDRLYPFLIQYVTWRLKSRVTKTIPVRTSAQIIITSSASTKSARVLIVSTTLVTRLVFTIIY